MELLNDLKSAVRDFLGGRNSRGSQTTLRFQIYLKQVGVFFRELMGNHDLRSNGGKNLPSWMGKLAPIPTDRPDPRRSRRRRD